MFPTHTLEQTHAPVEQNWNLKQRKKNISSFVKSVTHHHLATLRFRLWKGWKGLKAQHRSWSRFRQSNRWLRWREFAWCICSMQIKLEYSNRHGGYRQKRGTVFCSCWMNRCLATLFPTTDSSWREIFNQICHWGYYCSRSNLFPRNNNVSVSATNLWLRYSSLWQPSRCGHIIKPGLGILNKQTSHWK